jgi:glycosyltransferase involved in cell wall biosynthesis
MKIAVIPTLNEEKNIALVMNRAIKMVDKVIIVDGLSSDNTVNIAKKFGKTEIVLEKKPGKGNALRKGFEIALKYRPKYMVMLDGDGEKDPNDIPKMVKWLKANNADMVVGFRQQRRSLGRKFFNLYASWWIRFATGYKIRDCLSGFNIIKTACLERMKLISNNFEIETELILEARKNNLKVIEYPVSSPKKSPSRLKKRHMKEINIFFDKWILNWNNSRYCDNPFYKKIFLNFFCRLGLLIFR